MTTFKSNTVVGCASVGLLFALACSVETRTGEPATTESDELRRGDRSSNDHARRGGRRDNDRGHRHGPRCGHGNGNGNGHGASGGTGGAGKGGGAGTFSTGGSSSGGTSTGGGAEGGSGGTAGTFTGGTGTGGGGGSPDPGVCGDGELSFDEQCDDANVVSGDGCNDACGIEPGFTCDYGGACREVVCGDSLQDSYAIGGGAFDFEACDDGNNVSGDGCDNVCDIETGFVCFEPGTPCREVVCGDGFQDGYFIPGEGGTGGSGGGSAGASTGGFPGTGGSAGMGGGGTFFFENCDDGNVTPGDGCDATCDVEDGFVCERPGEPCREPRCGDGFIDFIPGGGGTGGSGGSGFGGTSGSAGTFGTGGSAGMGGGGTFEQCDDGNSSASDGCDASCNVEPGFACPEPAVPCHTIVCGDGITDWPAEECDDGNDEDDDGCTDCQVDDGGGTGGIGGFGGTGVAGSSGSAGSSTTGGFGG